MNSKVTAEQFAVMVQMLKSLLQQGHIDKGEADMTMTSIAEENNLIPIYAWYSAIVALPDKQAKRVYAHYFLDMSKTAIAKSEGVSKATVGESIYRALKSIKKFLEKN